MTCLLSLIRMSLYVFNEEMRKKPSRQKGWYDYVKHRGEKWHGGGNYRGSVLEHKTGQSVVKDKAAGVGAAQLLTTLIKI